MFLGLPAALGVIEYRTNIVAGWLGDWLADSNHLRSRSGGIWENLKARADAEAGLSDASAVVLPDQGLPDVVRKNRFGYRRAPESGPAGYAVVWMEPASGTPESRAIQDILQTFRYFRTGLGILQNIGLPETRYRLRALEEAAALYTQLAGSTDGLPDSSRAQLLEELTIDIILRLQTEEQSDLVAHYQAGSITQIELRQALGEYVGDITFSDNRPPIRFTLSKGIADSILTPLPNLQSEIE